MNHPKTPKQNRNQKQLNLLETSVLWPFIAAMILTVYSFLSWGYVLNKYAVPIGFGGAIYMFLFPPVVFLFTWVYGVIVQRGLQKFSPPAYVRLIATLIIPVVAIPFIVLNYGPIDGAGSELDYLRRRLSGGN